MFGGKEGGAGIEIPQKPAHDRPEHKAKSKRRANHAEGLATRFRLGDIGNIGVGRCIGGAGDTGQGPAEEEKPKRKTRRRVRRKKTEEPPTDDGNDLDLDALLE